LEKKSWALMHRRWEGSCRGSTVGRQEEKRQKRKVFARAKRKGEKFGLSNLPCKVGRPKKKKLPTEPERRKNEV